MVLMVKKKHPTVMQNHGLRQVGQKSIELSDIIQTKDIYRVITNTGCVDVTEDHSLLNENAEKVTPAEVKIGDNLLHADGPILWTDKHNHSKLWQLLIDGTQFAVEKLQLTDEHLNMTAMEKYAFLKGFEVIAKHSGSEIYITGDYDKLTAARVHNLFTGPFDVENTRIVQ